MTLARARCHQPLRRGRGGSGSDGAGAEVSGAEVSAATSASAIAKEATVGSALVACSSISSSSASATGDGRSGVSSSGTTPSGDGRGKIVRFGRGERLLARQRGGRIEAGARRLGRGFSVSSPEPVSTTPRTSRSTVTVFSAAHTPLAQSVGITARRNKVPADFGDDSQPVVSRLRGVRREVISKRALTPASASPSAAAAANLAFVDRGIASVLAQARRLLIVLAGRFDRLVIVRPDRRRLLDDRRDVVGQGFRRLRLALDASCELVALDCVVIGAGERVVALRRRSRRRTGARGRAD